MNIILKEIKLQTEIILNKDTTPTALLNACNSLYDFYCKLTDLNTETIITKENISTSNGDAIGTTWAAMCLKDTIRTKQFIKGLYKAIIDKQKEAFNKPIRILYAGTGPFATLALPLMTQFSANEIKFTFLEINPETISYLKAIIKSLGVEDYIDHIIQCDASEYQLQDTNYDIFLTETMQNSLRKEPQVPIAINIMQQLSNKTIMIPEIISVKATLHDLGKETGDLLTSEVYQPLILEEIIRFDKDFIYTYGKNRHFPSYEVALPKHLKNNYKDICLVTKIATYDDCVIDYKESGLTMPEKIANLELRYHKMNLQYTLGENPGFEVTIL